MAEIIRKKKFGKLALQMLRTTALSPRAKLLYMAVDAICGHKAGDLYHSSAEYGRLIGSKKTSAWSAMRELIDIGLIKRVSRWQLSYQPYSWEDVEISEGCHQPRGYWFEKTSRPNQRNHDGSG